MLETVLQKKVVDSVNAHGGFAFKLNNRFIRGVPDLFVSINGDVTLWEVKKVPFPRTGRIILPKLTRLQQKFLDDYTEKGGRCGVIVFAEASRDLWMSFFTGFNKTRFLPLARGRHLEDIWEILNMDLGVRSQTMPKQASPSSK